MTKQRMLKLTNIVMIALAILTVIGLTGMFGIYIAMGRIIFGWIALGILKRSLKTAINEQDEATPNLAQVSTERSANEQHDPLDHTSMMRK